MKRKWIWLFLSVAAFSPPCHAEILGYLVDQTAGATRLTTLIVNRGSGPIAYDAARLIPCRLLHFRSSSNRNVISPLAQAVPDRLQRVGLLGDLCLNSGVINPGGGVTAPCESPRLDGPQASPGLAVAFERPVPNLPGVDLVVFEIQRGDSPAGGDAFHVCPLQIDERRKSRTVQVFDVGFGHPSAEPIADFRPHLGERPPNSLKDLIDGRLQPATSLGGFKALAVGIDLSDLGYRDGETADALFFQDAGSPQAQVDLVLIAGLPDPSPKNVLDVVPPLAEHQPDPSLQDFLKGPLADVQEIVFAERVPGNDHWYANFGYYRCGDGEYPAQRLPENWQPTPIFKQGGRLCRLNLKTGQRTVLLDDPAGGVRDPQVHYDGKRILFSYRPGGQSHYHLFEIRSDGSELVQLTDGADDDIEPTYLPDGSIVFCSSRANRVVNCWKTPVATLHRCDHDGGNIRPISTNIEQDNTPWMLPDGRLLYMRWEYVDRNQLAFHHLWTIQPDGTGQMVYYGNQYPGTDHMNSTATATPGKHPGIVMLDAKPIPGTRQVVASFSPSHGRPEHMGAITIVDPTAGPDRQDAAVPISPPGSLYRDPYPISPDCFLVASAQGIQVMDRRGKTALVCPNPRQGNLQCHEPRPLQSRPREPILAPRSDPVGSTGHLVLSDICEGRNMDGVRPGEIQRLLVLEQLPKPVNFSGGPWPLSAGGTFSLARVLGTVPVDPDGSASFRVPANRSLFFVALDENDLSVKRMQSFVTVRPGETTSCVGCHEPRVRGPHVQTALSALSRNPSEIRPLAGVPDVLDFPRDMQPILDRHCASCHNPGQADGRVDLSGDHTPMFSQSYWTIVQRGLIADGRNESFGNRAPRTIGSSASRLMRLIDGSHHGVTLPQPERDVIRIWIETGATYPGTYAALGSGMEPVALPIDVVERRCGDCHGRRPSTRPAIGRGMYFTFGGEGPALPLVHEFDQLKQIRASLGYFKFGHSRTPQSLCNLTRPEQSLLLRAPLATEAGGQDRCSADIFRSTSDQDYRAILSAIRDAAERHRAAKRFDMDGFRPNDYYLREMQRLGILPEWPASDVPLDAYQLDQRYWQSFW